MREKPTTRRRTESTPVAGARRSVGGAAPFLAVAFLLAIVAGGWWLFGTAKENAQRNAARATAERRLAQLEADHARRVAQTAARIRASQALEAGVAASEKLIDDPNDTLLWASPTQGPPISMAYVPAGTLCLVHLRPAQLSSHPEGEKVLAALGPWGVNARTICEVLASAKLDEIDAALFSLLVARDGSIDASIRFQLAAPWGEAELGKRFPAARDQTLGDQKYLVDGKRAWFLAPTEAGRKRVALVTCPASMVQELMESEGDAPLLARDIEGLVATSDADRTVTAIVGAKFLAASGTHLMAGEAEPLRDAIAVLLGSDATAAALSLNWGDAFFAELRAAPALTVPARWLATTLQTRIADGADDIEAMVAAETWSAYGRGVVARFPAMVEKLAAMSRRGEAEKQAVVRAYLPAAAGHNLLMGAELLLTQAAPKGNVAQHAHADVGMAPGDASVEQRLAKVTSLTFPKETLQRAVELLAEDVGVAIEIDGAALRAEGITQNQSFALTERDKPAGEILVAILRLANPDRTATGPADPRQKLVYVVDQGAADGGRMIVTTRAAAAESGRTLPPVFGGDAR